MTTAARRPTKRYMVQYWDEDSNGWVIGSRHANEISATANFEVRCQSRTGARLILDGKIIQEFHKDDQ